MPTIFWIWLALVLAPLAVLLPLWVASGIWELIKWAGRKLGMRSRDRWSSKDWQ